MAPPSLNFLTTCASTGGFHSERTFEPPVVRISLVSRLSLTAIGRPCNGPLNCFCLASRSNSSACLRAASPATVMYELIPSGPSNFRIRSRYTSTICFELTSPSRIILDNWCKDKSAKSSSVEDFPQAKFSTEVVKASPPATAKLECINSLRFIPFPSSFMAFPPFSHGIPLHYALPIGTCWESEQGTFLAK